MGFRVEITDRAAEDIYEAVAFIALDSRSAAEKWKAGLESLILSLRDMPGRYPVIPEASELGHNYRSALHFSHRVVYRIDDEYRIVYVVRVYHGARQPLRRNDITNGFA